MSSGNAPDEHTAAPAVPARAGDPRQRTRGLGRRSRALLPFLPALLIGLLLGVGATLAIERWVRGGDADAVFTSPPVPEAPDMTVTLSYVLIAALIQQGIDSGETVLPLTNIQTGPSDGRLLVRGNVTVLGRSVAGSVELEPYVEDGQLRARVRRARLGPLPVPSNLERIAEGPLNRELAAALGNLPATLTSVRVTTAGLTVTADVRLDELHLAPR